LTDKPQQNIVKITNALASYAHVYTARSIDGDEKKKRFSMTALLDPSNATHQKQIKAVKAEALRVGKEKFPNIPENKLEMPYGTCEDTDVKPGWFFVKMWNSTRPLVVNRNNEPTAEGDAESIYSGATVNTNPTFFAWEFTNKDGKVMKRGVSANLRSTQFVAATPPFGRAAPVADEEFEALGDQADANSEDEWDK
jgi:hypothetical protein